MLDSTVESVNSALKRARASLEHPCPKGEESASPRLPPPSVHRGEVRRRYESGDVDALVALLTDDVFISMPPVPLEFQGREIAARFFASIFG